MPSTISKANVTSTKQSLRKIIKKQRQSLSSAVKRKKSKELQLKMTRTNEFRQSQGIAFYWPTSGEIDPLPILNFALKMGKRCYLPVLHPSKKAELLFVEYRLGDHLKLNRYGIREPILGHRSALAAWMLNLVFVPLLAFNYEGRRLGTGGGYYDRTFAFLKNKRKARHPKLIGLAYEFQKLETLPHAEWDLLLSGVATEKGYQILTLRKKKEKG